MRRWNRTNSANGLVNRMLHAKKFKMFPKKFTLHVCRSATFIKCNEILRIEISWKRAVFLNMKSDPSLNNFFTAVQVPKDHTKSTFFKYVNPKDEWICWNTQFRHHWSGQECRPIVSLVSLSLLKAHALFREFSKVTWHVNL